MLARPNKDLASRLPDSEGTRLWKVFHEQTLGRLAIVVDEDVDTSIFEHWLKVNGIKASLYEVLDVTDAAIKAEKVHRLATTMGRSDWYIDNDPEACAHTLRLGVPTLLVASPYVVRPEWSKEKSARPWDSLVQEINDQALHRANRTWGEGPLNYNGDDGR